MPKLGIELNSNQIASVFFTKAGGGVDVQDNNMISHFDIHLNLKQFYHNLFMIFQYSLLNYFVVKKTNSPADFKLSNSSTSAQKHSEYQPIFIHKK